MPVTNNKLLTRWLPAFGLSIIVPLAAAQVSWVPARSGNIPRNAVNGSMSQAKPMSICRAWHQNGVHPGKLIAGNCNIAWGDREIAIPAYEVLTGNALDFGWVRGSNGAVPANAVYGGQEPGRQLAVCRADYRGEMHPGKLVGNVCQIGWGGRAVSLPSYQVLVPKGRPQSAGNPPVPPVFMPMDSSLGHMPGTPVFPPQQPRGVPEFGAR